MAKLTAVEKKCFEKLLGMGGGYVLDFTDATFAEFFRDVASVNIEDPKYRSSGTSKAKRLRAFWELEQDNTVGLVLRELLELWALREEESDNVVNTTDAARCRSAVDRLLQANATRSNSTKDKKQHLSANDEGGRSGMETKKRVFISHSSKDRDLAKVLVDLLRNGIGVPKDDILCTSLPGYKLNAGEGVNETLREHLVSADVVILLVTEDFWGSRYSLCELGAAWALAKKPIPLLVAPLDYKSLKEVVSGVHALKLDRESEDTRVSVNDLQELLVKKLGLQQPGHNHWETDRKDFFRSLDEVLTKRSTISFSVAELSEPSKLAKKVRTSRSTADLDLAKATENSRAQAVENGRRGSGVEGTTSAVDEDLAHYERLVGEVRSALKQIPRVVVQVLYYHTKGERFRFDSEDREFVNSAVDEGMLVVDEEGASPNTKDPEVRQALSALGDLTSWLYDPVSFELRKKLEEEDGREPDLHVKGYWRDAFHASV